MFTIEGNPTYLRKTMLDVQKSLVWGVRASIPRDIVKIKCGTHSLQRLLYKADAGIGKPPPLAYQAGLE